MTLCVIPSVLNSKYLGEFMNELFDLPYLEVRKEVSEQKFQPKISALLKGFNKNLYNKENSIKLVFNMYIII